MSKTDSPIKISTKGARKAAEHLRRIHGETPVIHIETLERQGVQLNVYGKFENVNAMNTFKSRGSEWFVYNLMYEFHNRTGRFRKQNIMPVLVTSSAGNHAQGVALAAKRYGLEAEIFMPENASELKIAKVKELGAKVRLIGKIFDETLFEARKFQREEKARIFIPPYENPFIMEGQASVAAEILTKLCPVSTHYMQARYFENEWVYPDVVLCGLGGGGLASGMGAIFREFNTGFYFSDRSVKVIGVQTETADSMYQSVKAKGLRPSSQSDIKSIADGIAVKQASKRMLNTVRENVNQVVVVNERDIKKGIAYLNQHPHFNIRGEHPVEILATESWIWHTHERDSGIPFRKLPNGAEHVHVARPLYNIEGAAAAPYAAVLFGDKFGELNWKNIAGKRNELDVYVIFSGGNIVTAALNEINGEFKRDLIYSRPDGPRTLKLLGGI